MAPPTRMGLRTTSGGGGSEAVRCPVAEHDVGAKCRCPNPRSALLGTATGSFCGDAARRARAAPSVNKGPAPRPQRAAARPGAVAAAPARVEVIIDTDSLECSAGSASGGQQRHHDDDGHHGHVRGQLIWTRETRLGADAVEGSRHRSEQITRHLARFSLAQPAGTAVQAAAQVRNPRTTDWIRASRVHKALDTGTEERFQRV